jgi:transcriptional regulator with XRE-family HTH domain
MAFQALVAGSNPAGRSSKPSDAYGTLSWLKTAEKARARELRAQGWSVREIEQELGVARASVSIWVRDIILGPSQRERLLTRTRPGQLVAARRKAEAARAVRRAWQEEGRRLIHERDASYAAGCMLYWAEGAKARNVVELTNSDPKLVATFVAFLRRHFSVPQERMRVACNLFADHVQRQHEIESFWLERLGLPATALRKSSVNVYSKYSQKKRINKLPYGTCKFVVCDTRIVQTIYGSIQEYGGFERPEWLD